MIQTQTPQCVPNLHEILSLHKNLHINVYGSFITNSQKPGKIQMSINWLIDKQIMVHMYNAVLLTHKT